MLWTFRQDAMVEIFRTRDLKFFLHVIQARNLSSRPRASRSPNPAQLFSGGELGGGLIEAKNA
jgi:hypothetical protein